MDLLNGIKAWVAGVMARDTRPVLLTWGQPCPGAVAGRQGEGLIKQVRTTPGRGQDASCKGQKSVRRWLRVFNWCLQTHRSATGVKMTFCGLTGPLGCESRIAPYHGRRAEGQNAVPRGRAAQSPCPSGGGAPPLACGKWEKSKDGGRQAGSRPRAGKKGVSSEGRLTGDTLGRGPFWAASPGPKALSGSCPSFSGGSGGLGCLQLLSVFSDELHLHPWALFPRNILQGRRRPPAGSHAKPLDLGTMQATGRQERGEREERDEEQVQGFGGPVSWAWRKETG